MGGYKTKPLIQFRPLMIFIYTAKILCVDRVETARNNEKTFTQLALYL